MSRSPRKLLPELRIGDQAARPRHVGLHDRLFQRGARLALELVGAAAGQQLEQHHAERVDVGRGADRLAEDLLRRGVVGRERAAGELGQFRLLGAAVFEQLGDAEVEQPHFARLGDEDVGGLQVAVHDQARVRMSDRARHLQEQPQPGRHIERLARAVGVDALAFDVLQREIRLTVGREAGVVQPRDVRVLECGEDLALARQALAELGAPRHQARQLERHLAPLQHVGAFGQPHLAHAAFAEPADQFVRSDPGAGPQALLARAAAVQELRGLDLGQRIQRQRAGGVCRMFEQRAQTRLEHIELGVELLDPGRALGGRTIERITQQSPQRGPLGGRQIELSLHRRHLRRSRLRLSAPRRG